jgi:selenocysteine lyase/cysteine desulfurase
MWNRRTSRITPNVYTTLEEIDTFVTAMKDIVKNGVPV